MDVGRVHDEELQEDERSAGQVIPPLVKEVQLAPVCHFGKLLDDSIGEGTGVKVVDFDVLDLAGQMGSDDVVSSYSFFLVVTPRLIDSPTSILPSG